MNQSTTQTLDSAPPGGVTGRGSKEFRERVPVQTVPPSVEYEPNDPHRVGRTQWARDVYAGSAGKASQPRHRRQPRWTLHTIPARLISRGHPGAGRNTICPIHRTSPGGRPHMSAPILSFGTAQARRSAIGYLRLRLKPAHRSCGFVQGAWWPRTDQLHTELPPLLAALAPRVGSVDRVIYDETSWAPASLRMEFQGPQHHSRGLQHHLDQHTVADRQGVGRLVLLVVPPYTNPTRAYTAVMTASKPDDVSTPDELLGIGPREAQDRRLALFGAAALGVRRRSAAPSGP